MSKTIRLEDKVYLDLDAVRGKRETFSETVARLIDIYENLGILTSIAQGQQKYQGWLNEQLKKQPVPDR